MFDRSVSLQLKEIIQEELPKLIEIRHDLHAHPELMYQEHRTNKKIQEELKRVNYIEYKSGLAGGTGIIAHIPGDLQQTRPSPAIGFRADMDALPIEEATMLPYASKNKGVMHACGHDGHTTILIGVARVLARLAQLFPLPRPVTLLFQPAEEGGAGGKRMVEDGCLDGRLLGPPLEALFGLHGWPNLQLGSVMTRPGIITAAADKIIIKVEGKGAHAAFPHFGADPVLASSAIIGALQSIPSRNVDPLDSAVISITRLEAGTAHNIIPDSATLEGTIRTLKPETTRLVHKRVKEMVEGVAQAYGCRATVNIPMHYPATYNDAEATDIFNRVAKEALGESQVPCMESPVMAGEDFAFYTRKVSSCFFVLGLLGKGKDAMPGLHNPSFDFNDDAIATGVELFCRLALRNRN